ncbi:MAG TPA: hypothetical protein VNQ76_09375 [Planctomicrobium sp.]|nr:hypothetical protein [Planctomicrobium sp.]
MTDNYLDQLIQGYFDSSLTAEELAEFESQLSQSEAARKRFWKLAEVHGLARTAISIAWPDATAADLKQFSSLQKMPPKTLLSNRLTFPSVPKSSILILTVGVLLGMLTTGVAWAIVHVPRETFPKEQGKRDILVESFESGVVPLNSSVPEIPGIWSGDFTSTVGVEQGIHPFNGARMLRFLRADYPGKPDADDSYFSDVYRLIDLQLIRDEIHGGLAVIQASAMYNTIPPAPGERYGASIGMYAISREMASKTRGILGPDFGLTLSNESLAMARKHNPGLDHDPQTWEQVQCELRIPEQADYVLLHFSVCYSALHGRRVIFDGHYMDDVQVKLVHRVP